MKKRYFILISGIVQGVGFRPFIYNLAQKNNIFGYINNSSEGVNIDCEGEKSNLDNFINDIIINPPPLSKIENIEVNEKELLNYERFTINKSEVKANKITNISPDMATCDECLSDIRDKNNRRYRYPFTNCTNCGPRFSIIKEIPYDRDKTTMNKFKMCENCNDEYNNPSNRRFHAQPNACETCGPSVYITDNKKNNISCDDPFYYAQTKLKEGYIFAIKGLGGFHLCCDAENESAVKLLRKRKNRPYKPFALMAKNIETAKEFCIINENEKNILCGIRKPIVLLEKQNNISLSESIAPNQNTLGIMLPYTPLHELLFTSNEIKNSIKILVMTSANYYSLPLEYENDIVFSHLNKIADYFLMHNRDIYMPIDDSVVKSVNNNTLMIRRARGYVPETFSYKNIHNIFAAGSDMKNTFAIAKENLMILSAHNGDLKNLETLNHYINNIEHFKKIFDFVPKYAVCDMHPSYISTNYAEKLNVPLMHVQHHHAHIAGCMAENSIDEKVIGVSFDGTGYGTDGNLWGSEFMICDYLGFERAAHLEYVPLPGGEGAIHKPYRTAISYIHKYISDSQNTIINLFGEKSANITKIIDAKINCPESCSIGRFFDAVSAILGVCTESTYEGQASIELENILYKVNSKTNDCYNYSLNNENNIIIINPKEIIFGILCDINNKIDKSIISMKFHNTICNFTNYICIKLREKYNINKVALSGGVFQNSYLLKNIMNELKKSKFDIYINKNVPSNDGGISLGQLAIAERRISSNLV